ncbi:methyl-accepting chemotaxis protein [Comamonas nitrativorans]|uniref:Methyl-accepting chemotaxis protein n=1 Tax=Comamonas nitrativorans TaxID=108437 RepID=A0ABV9H231_9BURK
MITSVFSALIGDGKASSDSTGGHLYRKYEMGWKDMRISMQLMLGFALMGALLLGLGSVALWTGAALESRFDSVAKERMPRMALLNNINQDRNMISIAMRDMLLQDTADNFQQSKKTILERRGKIATQLNQLAAAIENPQARALLDDLLIHRQQYVAAQDKFLMLMDEQGSAAARQVIFVEAWPALQAFNQSVEALLRFQEQLLDESVREVQVAGRSLEISIWGAMGLAIVAATLLALQTSRAITGPLRQAVVVAEAVAGGDLAMQFQAQGHNETAQLLQALQQMLHGLRHLVDQIRSGSASVASASGQIAQANVDLSSRTEEQASALEETAASMEQLSATVQHNADSADQANQLAQSASAVALRGGAMIEQMVQTMQGINDSSHRIADIIGVIDSIAFQTNILALNAAVEAARAGEQGRGFAVVATEVRALAGRSAEAAREIKHLITDSVQRVGLGAEQVRETGATMQEIVGAIGHVTDLMSEISVASRQQSAGVRQVGEAVTHMDHMTQQNAALVEEMAAAANSLEGQAQELVRSVAVFQMGDAGQSQRVLASALAPSGRRALAG